MAKEICVLYQVMANRGRLFGHRGSICPKTSIRENGGRPAPRARDGTPGLAGLLFTVSYLL